MFSNELSPAQAERLAVMIEECGESLHAAGKILRHGYESINPDAPNDGTNRHRLERELGDLGAAIEMLQEAGDIDREMVARAAFVKRLKIRAYLHHQ